MPEFSDHPLAAAVATDTDQRLDSLQMAQFVADGYLRFDAVVPRDLCAAALEEMRDPARLGHVWQYGGRPFDTMWPGTATKAVFDLPRIRGAIHSLVGPSPRYDHHCPHQVQARQVKRPNLHQDAVLDRRETTFDIQLSFFPHDVPVEMGGTLFVPGSHFRRHRLHELDRYHHIVGEERTICAAGTVVIWHHNVWHGARSNRSDQTRYMFKLRLNPTVRQLRLWNTAAPPAGDPIARLCKHHGWYGHAEYRLELMQRILLWRALTGDAGFDIDSYWTRLENEPTTVDQHPSG